MCNYPPVEIILRKHVEYYAKEKINETRFVVTGISPKDCVAIIDKCEDEFGLIYDYIYFTEESLFPNEDGTHPYGCFYFFPFGTRGDKPLAKEEVINLYWY
ncbi:MAG: hypothetical protein M0R17_03550 [Candidatus Omnitrophica bacterium]|jgi:hypothetical protein|nr:hypothetical protein [Candidatus Omnitrophota bacterium]